MPDMETVIKKLHDARRYLEDKEWSDRCASPHIDAINDAISLLKDQQKQIEQMNFIYGFVYGGQVKEIKELIRCKDCKYVETCCRRRTNDPNWYCADGERRKEGDHT